MKAQHLSLPAIMMSLRRGLFEDSMYRLFNFLRIKSTGVFGCLKIIRLELTRLFQRPNIEQESDYTNSQIADTV